MVNESSYAGALVRVAANFYKKLNSVPAKEDGQKKFGRSILMADKCPVRTPATEKNKT